jgi:hypothetical protein
MTKVSFKMICAEKDKGQITLHLNVDALKSSCNNMSFSIILPALGPTMKTVMVLKIVLLITFNKITDLLFM